MPNYQNGKIYKITGTTDEGKELIYIGSTTQKLCKRLTGHKTDMKNNKNLSSQQVVKCIDCLITLIESCQCNSKEELLMRERYYYDLYDCINKIKPLLLKGEIKENFKQYRIKNIDKIKEKEKQYRIENADKIKQYYIENADKLKEINKQWRILNSNKKKETAKQYYIENADKIKEINKQYYLKKKQEIV
jgi:hypothetical protein